MSNKFFSTLAAFAFLAGAGASTGAVRSGVSASDRSASGKLDVIAASDERLQGRFTDGATSRSVEFEVLVGAPTPVEALQGDPTAPPFVMDARFADERGTFLVRFGGDSPLDPSWLGLSLEPGPEPQLSRVSSFRLARAAADALIHDTVGQSLSATMQSALLLELAQAIPGDELLQADEVILDTRLGRLDEFPIKTLAVQYVHEIEIRRKPAWININPAEHSAVIVRSRNMATNQLVFYMATSNHGTWADSSSMSTKCRKSFPYRTNIAPPLMANNECDRYSSYGFVCNKHVCNDDTRKQYLNVKYNSSSTSTATCTDCVLNLWAPSCD